MRMTSSAPDGPVVGSDCIANSPELFDGALDELSHLDLVAKAGRDHDGVVSVVAGLFGERLAASSTE